MMVDEVWIVITNYSFLALGVVVFLDKNREQFIYSYTSASLSLHIDFTALFSHSPPHFVSFI